METQQFDKWRNSINLNLSLSLFRAQKEYRRIRQRRSAIFYASQDVDAARRICAALRAAGIEVWLDQSELRGDDAGGWLRVLGATQC